MATGRFEGWNAVITGGTSGVGLATARLLCDGGARVVVTGRSDRTVDAARAELGTGAVAVRSDAGSAEDLDALARRVRDEVGRLDLVFLNAGITRHGPLGQMPPSVFDEVVGVNARGPLLGVQKFAPLVKRGGSIVLTSSYAADHGYAGLGAYAASKAVVRSLTRTFARELISQEVRVNAVTLGPIDTDFAEKNLGPERARGARERLRSDNPMGRFGRPEEVARAVLFLAAEATYTTGAELCVDGGASQL